METTPGITPGTGVAAVRVDVDTTITVLPDATYETLRDGVGGHIEAVPGDGSYLIWVNDDGKGLDLPHNRVGEALWYLIDTHGCLAAGDWMAGPCVVTGPADDDGDVTPLPEWMLSTIEEVTVAVRRHLEASR